MPARSRELIGREDELAAIVRLLDDRDRLPGVVVLHGEAGIGKTSVWLAGIEAAAERGYRVLSCRTSEAETRFTHAGLADLLGGAVADFLPELPPVQRRALEAALLLGDTSTPADERAVAAAFLAALRLLASEAPVCLAVDDLQWLDPASTASLRFALSRLGDDAVAGLFTIRGGPSQWLRRSLTDAHLATVEIGGLTLGALHHLVHTRLETAFPRPTLIRLWETSGGNPFFAVELATALLHKGGVLALGEALPIPATLDELLGARVDGLDAAALEVAQVVAALADPTLALVEAAVGADADAGLTEAVAAHILELDGERVRFTHPLLGSAVAASQTPTRRRSLHARLATIVPTAEERARHLALATAEPDGEIAATLEAAAQSAHARGAPATAAELAEQALRLTPEADTADARRRLFLAADRHGAAGDIDRATTLLERARLAAGPGRERATALARLARLEVSARDAVTLFREALSEAEDDDALQAEIHLNLAQLMRFTDGLERGVEHGKLAVLAASRADDVVLRCRAVAAHCLVCFNRGQDVPVVELEEALALERSLPEWPVEAGPTWFSGHALFWCGEVDRARILFHERLDAASAQSDPMREADAHWYLGLVEWRAGNWEEADGHASTSLQLMTQLGQVTPPGAYPAAIIAAHLGNVDEARSMAHAALAQSEVEAMGVGIAGHSWVLGFIELSLGDPVAALAHLRRAEAHHELVLEPGIRLELGDLLEALIATGELDEAATRLDEWEPRAAALDRAWSLAILARCRALLLAARGDLDDAFLRFEGALVEHACSVDPFQHARTLLALGRTQRRAKRRGDARATLEDALARFERVGAPLWAAQTRAEIARIGGRTSSRGELTEAERRIAGLVAEGRTNRQVAAALFITERSVETALTRVYRKLGVRSRAELMRQRASNS